MDALLTVLALTAFLFLLQQLLRFAGAWLVAGLYLAIPAALTAYWLRANEYGPFPWIKVYTVLFCACFGTAMRYTSFGNRSWAKCGIAALLALNILEATAVDLFETGPAHVLNALAGLGLLATLPRNAGATDVVGEGRRRELHYDVSPLWIVGYTVWNWTFVYLNYPHLAGHHTAVLTAALLAAAIDPRRWLQARAYTLGMHFIALLTLQPLLPDWLDTAHWSDPLIGFGAAGAALLVVAGCVARRFAAPGPQRGECLTRPCAA